MISASTLTLKVSPLPIETSPVILSSSRMNSRFVLSASESSSCARRLSSMPSSVSTMLWLLRLNSLTPSSSSSWISCRERVGWVKLRRTAALVMFSSLAAIRK